MLELVQKMKRLTIVLAVLALVLLAGCSKSPTIDVWKVKILEKETPTDENGHWNPSLSYCDGATIIDDDVTEYLKSWSDENIHLNFNHSKIQEIIENMEWNPTGVVRIWIDEKDFAEGVAYITSSPGCPCRDLSGYLPDNFRMQFRCYLDYEWIAVGAS